jgi:glutathione S-transferase
MAPTLYHIPKTISSPIVQCLLELDLVNKQVEVVETSFSGLKVPEYLALNPMGTSPAFQDGEIIIWESGAVLTYLLERYDTEHKLHPAPLSSDSTAEQIAARAKFLHLQHYILSTLYPFMASLFIHTFKPLDEQDANYVESAKEKWQNYFGPVLEKWLGEGPYFLGDQVSAVDFLASKPLNNANSMGLLRDFPSLQAFFEDMRSRPSFASAYVSMPSNSNSNDTNDGEVKRGIILVPGNW